MCDKSITEKWDRENRRSCARLGIAVWLTPWQFIQLSRVADHARVTMTQAVNAAIYAMVHDHLTA